MSENTTEEGLLTDKETGERLPEIAFTLHFDKEGLKQEKEKINPAGLKTLDTILRLPDKLSVPKGITIIVGPNGSGKSTLLGLLSLMGETTSLHKISQEREDHELQKRNKKNVGSWERTRDEVIKGEGKMTTIWKQLGIAPNIAAHTTVETGLENIEFTKIYRIPEIVGGVWGILEEQEMGYWESDPETGRAVFKKGVGLGESEIMGSTQQLIDEKVFRDIRMDLKSIYPNEPKLILLDEPTGSADLQRSLNFLRELESLNEENGNHVSFVVATNDGLLALHRNVPRIDMSHPERGVHYLRNYPLDQSTMDKLKEMGYIPA